MEAAVLAALARRPGLSVVQLRGVLGTVATLAPGLIADLSDRDDLDDELRGEIIRRAPRHRVVDVLGRWPAAPEWVDVVLAAHGAFPELVMYCDGQGWEGLAVETASQVDVEDVDHVEERWIRTRGPLPSAVRIALVHAALTERMPRPRLTEMSEWERREAMERLSHEEDRRQRIAWHLLEPAPELWEELAREGKHAMHVRRILLERPEKLADKVLLACLPAVTNDNLRDGDDLFAGIRLTEAADCVRRRPRLCDIAAAELKRLVREAVEDGWTPTGRFTGWKEITALAELTDDPALLVDAVTATRNAAEPNSTRQHGEKEPSWSEERAATVAALTANPATPRNELTALLPALDEAALLAVTRHSGGDLQAAACARLAKLREEEARHPTLIQIPSDEELADLDDPAEELRTHLKHLRTRAEQRDTTCEGLLRSRFTTPSILRDLPAHRVLESREQADLTARMIAETCGDNLTRWNGIAAHLDPPPRKAVTFGAWLDGLKTTTA
jgi:hypothetical protein